jgi:hypothetical protein
VSLDGLWDLLKTDKWYKVLTYVSAGILLLSIFFDVKVASPAGLQLVSLGVLLATLGEWLNNTTQTSIIPPNVYNGGRALKVTKELRRPTLMGVVLNVGGTILMIFGIAYWLGLTRWIGLP